MNCPYCGSNQTIVKETRDVNKGAEKRRYRQCLNCNKRFTTFEAERDKRVNDYLMSGGESFEGW